MAKTRNRLTAKELAELKRLVTILQRQVAAAKSIRKRAVKLDPDKEVQRVIVQGGCYRP